MDCRNTLIPSNTDYYLYSNSETMGPQVKKRKVTLKNSRIEANSDHVARHIFYSKRDPQYPTTCYRFFNMHINKQVVFHRQIPPFFLKGNPLLTKCGVDLSCYPRDSYLLYPKPSESLNNRYNIFFNEEAHVSVEKNLKRNDFLPKLQLSNTSLKKSKKLKEKLQKLQSDQVVQSSSIEETKNSEINENAYSVIFKHLLKGLSDLKDCTARYEALKNTCSRSSRFEDKFDYYEQWVKVAEGEMEWINKRGQSFNPYEFFIYMILWEGKYHTTTLDRNVLITKDRIKNNPSHYFIQLTDDPNAEDPFMHLRIEKDGQTGEIIHIKRSEDISGTDVLKHAVKIIQAFKIPQLYLHDKSKYSFLIKKGKTSEKDEVEELLMAQYLPITSKSGCTWYGEHLFVPMNCIDIAGEEKTIRTTQNRLYYYAAVKQVRTTSIASLYEMFKTDFNANRLLQKLRIHYLPEQDLSKATVHDLANAIYSHILEKHASINVAIQHNQNFVHFYHAFLSPTKIQEPVAKSRNIYNIALDTIYMHYLWEMHPLDASKDLSYPDFCKNQPVSFEKMVNSACVKPTPTSWSDIAKMLIEKDKAALKKPPL